MAALTWDQLYRLARVIAHRHFFEAPQAGSEDDVQEAVTRVWQKAATEGRLCAGGVTMESGLVGSVMERAMIDHRRRTSGRRGEPRYAGEQATRSLDALTATPAPGGTGYPWQPAAYDAAAARDALLDLVTAYGGLSPLRDRVLRATALGYPAAAIAAATGVGPGRVAQIMADVRKGRTVSAQKIAAQPRRPSRAERRTL